MSEQENIVPLVVSFQAIAISDNPDRGVVAGDVVATAITLPGSFIPDRDSVTPPAAEWELEVAHTWEPVYNPPKEDWYVPFEVSEETTESPTEL